MGTISQTVFPAFLVRRSGGPTLREVAGHVRDDRSGQLHRHVMPAERTMWTVGAAVVPVALEGGKVDPADERHRVLDDDDLLMMAVQRTFPGVEDALYARAAVNPSRTVVPILRVGWNIGIGGPADNNTRTGTRWATSASSSRSVGAAGSRIRRKSGEACQPAMCT
jgi:hypothetical protein